MKHIIKTIVENCNKNLDDIDKILIENNRRITELISTEKLDINFLNLLIEIKRNNNLIISHNKNFKETEIID